MPRRSKTPQVTSPGALSTSSDSPRQLQETGSAVTDDDDTEDVWYSPEHAHCASAELAEGITAETTETKGWSPTSSGPSGRRAIIYSTEL